VSSKALFGGVEGERLDEKLLVVGVLITLGLERSCGLLLVLVGGAILLLRSIRV